MLTGVMEDVVKVVREAAESAHRLEDSPYAADPPVLRAISPLAEGSDRFFAEAALEFGYELCCILPFEQAELEKDFEPSKALETSSLERFRALLAKATTLFELDGRREDEGAAYGAGGRLVLRQSDLLVIVWDGERQGKAGGTEQTFDEARALGVPVVWIDAHAPHAWEFLEGARQLPGRDDGGRVRPGSGSSLTDIKRHICEGLTPPGASGRPCGRGGARDGPHLLAPVGVELAHYLAETKPRLNHAVWWKSFRDLVGKGRLTAVGFGVPHFEQAVEQEWPRGPWTPVGRVVDALRPFYAWPDQLAVCYSDAYRSAFLWTYLLAAVAVGWALLPVGAGWFMASNHVALVACGIAETLTILVVLGLVVWGRRCKWHDRWLDYRLCAEMVRHLRLVVPVGGERPFLQVPAHLNVYVHPETLWVSWYVGAIERGVGMPSARVDRNYLADALRDLRSVLEGQLAFHRKTSQRDMHIEHRLHAAGVTLLVGTLLACAAHVASEIHWPVESPKWVSGWTVFLCGFLPALGAALAGIKNQGEFVRVSKRSEAMEMLLGALLERVTELEQKLEAPSNGPLTMREVARVAEDASRLMVNEVLDWRVVFADRPPEPPA